MNLTSLPFTLLCNTFIIIFIKQTEIIKKNREIYNFLSKELEVEQIEAIKKFHEYIYEIKATASEGNVIQFNGIGTISKQSDGTFTFQQEKNAFDFCLSKNCRQCQ